MNNFTTRTITGGVYVIAVVSAIMFNPIVLSVFFGLVALVSLYEFYKNSKIKDIFAQNILGFTLAITTYLSFSLKAFEIDNKYAIALSLLLVFLIFIIELYNKKGNRPGVPALPFHRHQNTPRPYRYNRCLRHQAFPVCLQGREKSEQAFALSRSVRNS